MKFSRTVTYAVRATLELAKCGSNSPVPCSRLAASGNMPERFLLQILRDLVNHGILKSTRGIDGGYALNRRPEEVSLLDVIEAIDGPLDFAGDGGGNAEDSTHSRFQAALRSVTYSARQQLESIKLSQLLPAPRPRPTVVS